MSRPRLPTGARMTTVGFTLPGELRDHIYALADKTGKSASEVVRQALAAGFAKPELLVSLTPKPKVRHPIPGSAEENRLAWEDHVRRRDAEKALAEKHANHVSNGPSVIKP